MHVPALNIPGFAGVNGLPIGLTAVGPRFADRHVLHVAETIGPIFEEEGGWARKNVDAAPGQSGQSQGSAGYRST